MRQESVPTKEPAEQVIRASVVRRGGTSRRKTKDLAEIDHDRRRHQAPDSPEIERAELLPLGDDDEGVGVLRAFILYGSFAVRSRAVLSTISRLENLPDARALLRMGRAMVSFHKVPRRITLDIDDTFDAVHGSQQLRLFNAHYGAST